MQGIDLEIIARTDPSISQYFMGVFSIDSDWPEPLYPPASYIINTDTENGPGEHWISFFIDNNGHADYFDSYGFPPNETTLKWLRNRASHIYFNTHCLQGPLSTVCWAYCLYFLHMRSRHIPMDYIVNLVKGDEADNLVLSVAEALL